MPRIKGSGARVGVDAKARIRIRLSKQGFKPDRTLTQLEKIARAVNRRFGGYVRKTARSSMHKAKLYTAENQLTPELLLKYKAARRRWHRRGESYAEPKLPPMPSRPGEPPREVSGELKKFLLYAEYAEGGQFKVIVGPKRLDGGEDNKGEVPRLHEYSGVGISTTALGVLRVRFPRRSYMQPAAEKALPQIPGWVRQAAIRFT